MNNNLDEILESKSDSSAKKEEEKVGTEDFRTATIGKLARHANWLGTMGGLIVLLGIISALFVFNSLAKDGLISKGDPVKGAIFAAVVFIYHLAFARGLFCLADLSYLAALEKKK